MSHWAVNPIYSASLGRYPLLSTLSPRVGSVMDGISLLLIAAVEILDLALSFDIIM